MKPFRLVVYMHDIAGDDPITGKAIPYRTFVSDHSSRPAARRKIRASKRALAEFYSHAEIHEKTRIAE